jgi:hypothetical protein
MDDELERFKTEIDLREFAASLGFAIDPRRTCRSEAVMKLDQRDTLVISRDTDGHYIYFSLKGGHSGTVIDLARVYVSPNFGEIRKALRRFAGAEIPATLPALQKTTRDLDQVARDWHAAGDYAGYAWLEGERAIPSGLLMSARFEGCLKVDGRGNVLFAHRNLEDRLCGFEKKNRGFTGFSGGGEKGLGCSNAFPCDRRIVLAESFIDMLSYAALFPDERARYASFGGGLSPKQPELIRAHILALPRSSEVVVATDGDDAGEQFAQTIRSLCDGYAFLEQRPALGDWNDVLRRNPLPSLANEP